MVSTWTDQPASLRCRTNRTTRCVPGLPSGGKHGLTTSRRLLFNTLSTAAHASGGGTAPDSSDRRSALRSILPLALSGILSSTNT